MASASPKDIKLIALVEVDGVPLARDLDIGKSVGFAWPRAIRQVIERNRVELEAFGPLATVCGKSRGQEFTEYRLSEEQAILAAVLSNAPKAPDARRMIISVFVAWRRGHLVPVGDGAPSPLSIADDERAKSVIGNMIKNCSGVAIREALKLAIPQIVDDVVRHVASDNRNVATTNVSIREILDRMHVPSKKRRSLQARIFHRLNTHCLLTGIGAVQCVRTGTWLWPVIEATSFIRDSCVDLIREHRDTIERQGRLKLVPREPERKSPPA